MLLIVIINALNYELFIEMTGSLCKENSLLPPGYSFSCEIQRHWKMTKKQKNAYAETDDNTAKEC